MPTAVPPLMLCRTVLFDESAFGAGGVRAAEMWAWSSRDAIIDAARLNEG
jgi:hypothetical protein